MSPRSMQDSTPVKTKPPPKAITVEDSFKSCTSLEAVRHIARILAPDLLARLHEEFQVGHPFQLKGPRQWNQICIMS